MITSVILPSESELENVIRKFTSENKISESSRISLDKITDIRRALKEMFLEKISKSKLQAEDKEYLGDVIVDIVNAMAETLKSEKSSFLSENLIISS